MPKKKRIITKKTYSRKKGSSEKERKHFSLLPVVVSKSLLISSVCLAIVGGIIVDTIVSNRPKREIPDKRIERVDTYFRNRNMPLAGYGKYFIAAADTCNMDWRLLPAIAVRESSGGKRLQNNNPFGWGGARIPFENFEEAIAVVGKNLCGDNEKTAQWYNTTSTHRKLYYYNGTVISTYPQEVLWIMEQF